MLQSCKEAQTDLFITEISSKEYGRERERNRDVLRIIASERCANQEDEPPDFHL